MHRNLLLHPIKYSQTPSPGTSSASTVMAGGFLRTAGLARTTAASHFGVTVGKHRGFTQKQTLVRLQVHKAATGWSRKCQIRARDRCV